MKLYISFIIFLLSSLLKLSAQCTTVRSISENFDGWKGISSCWDTQSGLSMVYAKNNRITFYSLMTPKEDMYLISPRLNAGTYTLSFDISVNGGTSNLQLFAIGSTSEKSSYVSLGKSQEINAGKKLYTFKLNKSARIGIKVLLTEMHQAVYVDNVVVESI